MIYLLITFVTLIFTFVVLKKFQQKKDLESQLKKHPLVIDIRTIEEYQDAHSPSAMNIPLDELETKIEKYDRATPIVLVCASGARAIMGKQILHRLGFVDVVNGGSYRNLA